MKPIYAILLAIGTGLVGGAIGFFLGEPTGVVLGTGVGTVYGGCKALQTAEKDGLLKPEQSQKVIQETTKQVIATFGVNQLEGLPSKIDCQELIAGAEKGKAQK